MGFYIDMIDVGQGDCFLLNLETSSGDCTILIDGGPPGAGPAVVNFVKSYASAHLSAVIVTHLDIDHLGGLKEVVNECSVAQFRINLPPGEPLKVLKRQLLERAAVGKSLDIIEKSIRAATDLVDVLQA